MATTVVTLGPDRKMIAMELVNIMALAGIIPPNPKSGEATVAIDGGQPSTFTLASITDYNGTALAAWADQAATALTPDQVAILGGVDGIMPIIGKCEVMPGLYTWTGSVMVTFLNWEVTKLTVIDPTERKEDGTTQAYGPNETAA